MKPTFTGVNAGWDVLQEKAFPRLHLNRRGKGLRFQAIDLW